MRQKISGRLKAAATLCAASTVMQLGACDFGTITITQTVGAEELVVNAIRGLILTPIDQFVTNAIHNAFDNDDEE